MAIQCVAWVLEHETTTSGAERLVLLSLANHAGWQGGRWECYPSVERIGREAGIGRRQTIKDAMNRLIARGLVVRAVNAAPDVRIPGNRRPNLYYLNLTAGGTETAPPERVGDSESDARGLGLRASGGTDTEPQTVSEPPVEPTHARTAFDEFWSAYPRKVGKPTARTAFFRAVKRGSNPDAIVAGARRCAREWKAAKTEERFIPHPSTWLNDDRWNDRATGVPVLLDAPVREVCGICNRYTLGLIECPMDRVDCPAHLSPTVAESVGNHPASRAN